MDDCVFCNIVQKKIPGETLFEDSDVLVVRDILPKAPVHLLVIPRVHIPSIVDATQEHERLLGHMILVAKQVAVDSHIDQSGYRLVFNVGKHGGQLVPHLHLHVLGGKQLAE